MHKYSYYAVHIQQIYAKNSLQKSLKLFKKMKKPKNKGKNSKNTVKTS